MAPKPPSPDDLKKAIDGDPLALELDRKRGAEAGGRVPGDKSSSLPPKDVGEEHDGELELEEDEEDEDLVVFTAKEAAGALATIYAFVKPFLKNYKKILAFVGLGIVVETLFNVIMPLSLKFLIDDALGEEDFEALVKILSVLAVAGIFTSIVAVWYERWDAKLAACVITDVRTRLFEHVQNLPSAYFARTKRGEILSRFSVDLSAFEGSIKGFANGAALPFLELIAGIILMLFLNWQLAVISLLVFPITLIGPRILTPKAVQANYEQKLNESTLLGMVQENIAAQAVVKAFSLQRRTLGWFTMRNDEARQKIASAAFLSTMVERTVTISVLLLHLVVLAIGAYLATKGQITIGTSGRCPTISPTSCTSSRCRSSRRRPSITFRNCWMSRPAARTGPARPTCPASLTTSLSTASPFSTKAAKRRCWTISVSNSTSGKASPSSGRAAPARAHCST